MRPSFPFGFARPRRGRVLVECCVALVLLAGGSTLVLLLASSTALLADEARQQDLVQRATGQALAILQATPCAVATASTRTAEGPRTVLEITTTELGPWRQMRVLATWQAAGLVAAGTRAHDVTSAGWCE